MRYIESSLNDLYKNIVVAFPRTTKRQYSIDTVKVTQITWNPFIGLNTLLVKSLIQNEGKEYNPTILFKKVVFFPEKGNIVEIIDNTNRRIKISKISTESNDVMVRCQCKDFLYRFHNYNYLDKSLYGKDRKKYESMGGPPANPMELPGVCKHILKFWKSLEHSGVI